MRTAQIRSPLGVLTLAVVLGMAAPIALDAQDDVLRRNQDGSELRSDWLIGSTVTTPDGQNVGSIDALLLDQEEGEVTGAVLNVGGLLGFGAKQIAVQWEQIEIAYDGAEVILPITVDEAEEAPEFAFRDRQQPPPPPVADPAAGGGMGTVPQGGVGGTAPQ